MFFKKRSEFKKFCSWLDAILENPLPKNTKGICFNLYKEVMPNFYGVQFIATGTFNLKDDEWACDSILSSEENIYYLVNRNGQHAVEKEINGLIESYLKKGKFALALKNCDGIGFGFVDGDLTIVYTHEGYDNQKEKKNSSLDNDTMNDTSGWDAIEKEFLRVYPAQINPKHYGTLIKWRFGGNDPLDGISIYDGGSYWHFVSFGLTEMYNKECDDKEISGYGYELTFKLKKDNYADEEAELKNVCGILQSIARLVCVNGERFLPNEYIYTGQTTGIDAQRKSELTGFIIINDPSVETLETPNGKVTFLELIGMTDAELKTLSTKTSVATIYNKLGSDITDYNRKSIVY